MRMGKIDIVAKAYLSDTKRFSDIFNFWIYGGENVIQADALKEMDTTEIALPYGNNAKVPIQKFRDILKLYTAMQDDQTIYLVLGLEVESKTHYGMVVRNMLYDAMNYVQQVAKAADAHRKNADVKPTNDEYLSGLWKEDRLMPVITLVVNISGKPWDGATSLHDMLAMKDKRILPFVQDYRLNLLSPDKITDTDFDKFHTGLGAAMQFIKHQHDENMDWMQGKERFQQVDRATVDFIQTATGTRMQFDEKDEVVNVCKAWENGLKQARLDGENTGEQRGIQMGENNMMTAIRMLKEGKAAAIICEQTGLTNERLLELKAVL